VAAAVLDINGLSVVAEAMERSEIAASQEARLVRKRTLSSSNKKHLQYNIIIHISPRVNINAFEGNSVVKSQDDIKANDATEGENAKKSLNAS
jgi:hypothetical protein